MRKMLILMLTFVFLSIFGNIILKVGIYDYYPACYLKDNKPDGFVVKLFNYIAAKENWKIEYEFDVFLIF